MGAVDWSGLGVRRSSISAEVAAHVEQLIATGALKPGDKLPPERDLADQLGVSRTSVRAAMQELSLRGLTDRKPGRGTIVVDPGPRAEVLLGALSRSERQLLHTMDLRQVIEPSVAERAAERATPANVSFLEDALRRAEGDLDVDESVRLDEEFHELIAHATQNPLLITLVGLMKEWLVAVRHDSHSTAAGRAASLEGHRRILEAIRSGNAAAARAAMVDHISEVGDIIAQPSGADEKDDSYQDA